MLLKESIESREIWVMTFKRVNRNRTESLEEMHIIENRMC